MNPGGFSRAAVSISTAKVRIRSNGMGSANDGVGNQKPATQGKEAQETKASTAMEFPYVKLKNDGRYGSLKLMDDGVIFELEEEGEEGSSPNSSSPPITRHFWGWNDIQRVLVYERFQRIAFQVNNDSGRCFMISLIFPDMRSLLEAGKAIIGQIDAKGDEASDSEDSLKEEDLKMGAGEQEEEKKKKEPQSNNSGGSPSVADDAGHSSFNILELIQDEDTRQKESLERQKELEMNATTASDASNPNSSKSQRHDSGATEATLTNSSYGNSNSNSSAGAFRMHRDRRQPELLLPASMRGVACMPDIEDGISTGHASNDFEKSTSFANRPSSNVHESFADITNPPEVLVEAKLVEENNGTQAFSPQNSRRRSMFRSLRRLSRRQDEPELVVEAVSVNMFARRVQDIEQKFGERRLHCCCCFILILLAVLAVVLPLALLLPESGRDSSSMIHGAPTKFPTIQQVVKNGVLRCGVREYLPALRFLDKNGKESGFDVHLCGAISAAIFGPSAKVDLTTVSASNRFQVLAEGSVDVLIAGVTHTMARQIYHQGAGVGFTFSAPYVYMGLKVAGVQHFVQCVDQGFKNTDECSELRICMLKDTTHETILSSMLPGSQLDGRQAYDQMIQGLMDGDCNLIAGEGTHLGETTIREAGYTGEYVIGEISLSKEPLAIVSRSDDVFWSSFVNSILQALFTAEEHDIRRSRADDFPDTELFGDNYKNMFKHAIGVSGNYGEMYDRFFAPVVARDAINQINDGTGLLYSHPLGTIDDVRHDPDGFLEKILNRGLLRCAIRTGRPGFAIKGTEGAYSGIEVDYCNALSAALFSGALDRVDFIQIEDGVNVYEMLKIDEVDVVTGATWTLSNYVREETTNTSFAFSPPYFYNQSSSPIDRENLCLATSSSDHLWSSFVQWIVWATVLAEEEGFTRQDSMHMPEVKVFGSKFERIFRDAVYVVGNAEDIYERNVGQYFPRTGRNRLNPTIGSGPQHYVIPGIVP